MKSDKYNESDAKQQSDTQWYANLYHLEIPINFRPFSCCNILCVHFLRADSFLAAAQAPSLGEQLAIWEQQYNEQEWNSDPARLANYISATHNPGIEREQTNH
ncbi:MAG: hypothetical protein EON98_00015 [Chitinophagaceae bacterium]|nr:MAG: hypothetical protein EON98_00015 [Chitinophagaceae bacterium]